MFEKYYFKNKIQRFLKTMKPKNEMRKMVIEVLKTSFQ